MPLSSFALIIGVVLYALGFPLIFGDKDVVAWRKRVLKDEDKLRVIGIAFAVLAVLALKTQWYITADAGGPIVVLAWLTLAKALLLAWWPDQPMAIKSKLEDRMLATPLLQTVSGILMVFIGALLIYLGLVYIY